MKNNIIIGIVIILFVALLGFIIYNQMDKEYQLNDVIKLNINKSAIVEDLKITLVSIEDSTCPKGVECISAGEYSYELLVNNEIVSLSSVNKKSNNFNDYKFTLTSDTSSKYIEFKVSK